MKLFATTLAVAACLGPVACKHTPGASGASSFRFVEPVQPANAAAARTSEPAVATLKEYRDVLALGDLENPIYPADALKARAGWATVGLTITVGTDGRVASVQQSMIALSTPGPFAAAFRTAVEAALARWTFRPAEIRHVEPVAGPDGTTWTRVLKIEKVERTFDVSFTFTADGKAAAAKR